MKMSYKRRILYSFLVATIILFTVALSFFASFAEMKTQKAAVDHTYEVISKTQSVLSGLKDVQSSQRGYVITGLDDYMAPYHQSIPKILEDLDILGRLVGDNSKQLERYHRLGIHVNERLKIADLVVQIYKDKGQEAAFDEIKKGVGKREMDEVRLIANDMVTEEQALLNKRQNAMELSSELTVIAGLAGLGTCFIILVAVFALINREAEQRVRTEMELQATAREMEAIANETKMIGKIGDYLRACRNESEAYTIIEKNMPIIFAGTYGSVSIFNNSRNMLQTVLRWGDIPAIEEEFEPDDCWALRQGRIHRSANDGAVPMCKHLNAAGGSRISVCLPMQAQGETIGQIFIGSAEVSGMSDHQIMTLRTVGEQISLALANLHLQRALREQSIKDPLTKLFNRRYLEETLAREIARASRNKQPIALLIMDIDFFKKVNDTYGHDGGDAVLIAFAKLLSSKIRKEDIACRLGGEEFVLVLPSASEELAKIRAEEICEVTRALKIKHQNQTITITVSIGTAMFPEQAPTGEELIQNADIALYKAKHNGRDQVVAFDPAMAVKG